MKYFNAKLILPDALVKELQNYVQGGYIYVPIQQEQQKRWGEVSGYRQELEQRNAQMGKWATRVSFVYSAKEQAVWYAENNHFEHITKFVFPSAQAGK